MPSVCAICGGRRYIPKPDDPDTEIACPCVKIEQLQAYLGPEIAGAKAIPETPLFRYNEVTRTAEYDGTNENLFLKIIWKDLVPHLQCALIPVFKIKGLGYRFKIVSDQKLCEVWLGKDRRNTGNTDGSNCLSDCIGKDYALVIIRIGLMGYPNKAAAGVLLECLKIREYYCLPTWVVAEDFENEYSFSYDVAEYLKDRFSSIFDDVPEQEPNETVTALEPAQISYDVSPDEDERVTTKRFRTLPKKSNWYPQKKTKKTNLMDE